MNNKPMTKNQIIRLLFSILLVPIGAVMILIAGERTSADLLSKLGLAFIVAGVVSTFHEAIIRRLERREACEEIADEVHTRLKETPLSAVGIRLVSPIRKGYGAYYRWALDNTPQDMFFAGRSVLHRIDADFRERTIGTAEGLLTRRLVEGASIKIMFLNPSSKLIPRLAREEGQTDKQLIGDIGTSLGICHRLYHLLQNEHLPPHAVLDIRVFDEVPYFAYHRVGDDVIVGFYFSSALGHTSAAYDVVDRQTRTFFGEHFLSIFGRASGNYVLRTHPHNKKPDLNVAMLEELRTTLSDNLGEKRTDELVGEKHTRTEHG